MTAAYDLTGVGLRYGPAEVLSGVTLRLAAPGLVSIVGPNGAGKTTLLGILARLRDQFLGACLLDGRDLRRWPARAFARRVSFVPQSLRLDFPFTAEQVVMMGRTPYAGGLYESAADHDAVERALALCDATAFRGRDFRTLSGGERQRVVLACALAQQPEVLLLDEPATFLDIEHQLATYSLLRRLAGDGILVVAVTHDLNLAAQYSSRVIALKHGRVAADGPPAEALSPAVIARVFGVTAHRLPAPGGTEWIAYGA